MKEVFFLLHQEFVRTVHELRGVQEVSALATNSAKCKKDAEGISRNILHVKIQSIIKYIYKNLVIVSSSLVGYSIG